MELFKKIKVKQRLETVPCHYHKSMQHCHLRAKHTPSKKRSVNWLTINGYLSQDNVSLMTDDVQSKQQPLFTNRKAAVIQFCQRSGISKFVGICSGQRTFFLHAARILWFWPYEGALRRIFSSSEWWVVLFLSPKCPNIFLKSRTILCIFLLFLSLQSSRVFTSRSWR